VISWISNDFESVNAVFPEKKNRGQDLHTVKASNFETDGNFQLFFSKGLAIIKARPTE
jgi:hypothetical protein